MSILIVGSLALSAVATLAAPLFTPSTPTPDVMATLLAAPTLPPRPTLTPTRASTPTIGPAPAPTP